MTKLIKTLLLGFIILSFYALPLDTSGGHAIFGRTVAADFFGLLAAVVFLVSAVPKSSNLVASAYVYCGCLIPGLLVSISPGQTLVDVVVHFFLVTVFMVGVSTFNDKRDFHLLLTAISVSATLAALSGIYENSTHLTGLPSIFPKLDLRDYKGASFRNSGQAGAFFMVMLTILIPSRYSSLGSELRPAAKKLVAFSIWSSAICMIMTVKIASLIGICVGVTLLVLVRFRPSFAIPFLLFLLLLFGFSDSLGELFPRLKYRITNKTETRLNIEALRDEDSFISANWAAALNAFDDNPLVGSGIMGFQGKYDTYEVHSTPLKLIGETGLVGIFGYSIFIMTLVQLLSSSFRVPRHTVYSDFLSFSLPLMVGCCVSWLYTYHMRKREFWILMIVVFLATKLHLRLCSNERG